MKKTIDGQRLPILATSVAVLISFLVVGLIFKFAPIPFLAPKAMQKLQQRADSLAIANLELKSKLTFLEAQSHAENDSFENQEDKDRALAKVHDLERKILERSNTFSELKIVVDHIKFTSPNFTEFPTIVPLRPGTYKRLSSGFGTRKHPILKVEKFHQGIDISAVKGTVVYAPANGKVLEVNSNARGYGAKILLGHQFGFRTIFGHLSGFLVKQGDWVKVGQPIGLVGSTGLSTGPHLHYEILKNGYKIDPVEFTRITEAKLAKPEISQAK